MDIQQIKQRFGIIGSSPALDRGLNIAAQVALTDLAVLISGESGTGKEVMPQIIHQLSSRKHNKYIAVNCGAIPEGTIDSELFGHEKGAFTGAHDSRKGYFEVVDGGTIFLDEVGELPITTQARLLRVLETGEFIKVGSSKVLKTNVRIVAATNVNIPEAIKKGKFREDLFYRLNTVPIQLPPLRERKEDIHLLFRKFAADLSAKYRMPSISLDNEAIELLINYKWPGNIRQLKNVAEQLSVIESSRNITAEIISKYLPKDNSTNLPAIYQGSDKADLSERDILYKVLFDLKSDVTELKKLVFSIMNNQDSKTIDNEKNTALIKSIQHLYTNTESSQITKEEESEIYKPQIISPDSGITQHEEVEEESLSLADKEKEMILKALEKYNGRRKNAATELGISERTLYRKIKEYKIDN
ncbi:sigma-54-dependent Fis family transcriptional regulator [Vicingus serpentipes]|uniref:Sigma-54-dependent Fis family transcriptional regulator n=2 Tax=Vicingus serpentipes TaxID=1926625 RepID=A0A5C6RPN8_9FLAO|nr:sigma-54-dependent Fis family transcriptional regulator [Vicingus serpentipes]